MNELLFLRINGLAGRSPFLDQSMILLAQYAIFVVPLFLIVIGFKKSKKEGFLLFVSAMLSWFWAYLITLVYFHPRPFMIGLGKPLFSHPPESSFPSDHATILAAISFTLLYLK